MIDDRPPLVLLHGFPMDSRIWADLGGLPVTPTLPSLYEFTHSSGRTPDTPFTIDDLADAVHGVVAWLGRPCVVGGLSMGGYVALSLADRHPADLAGLVLFDTKATADDAAARQDRDWMIDVALRFGAGPIAAQMEPRLLARLTGPAVRRRFHEMAQWRREMLAHALAALRDRPDRTAALARVTVPALCVVGAHDEATPPAVVEDMRRQIPTARPLVVIPDAGHIPPMENPAAVTDALRAFLRSL